MAVRIGYEKNSSKSRNFSEILGVVMRRVLFLFILPFLVSCEYFMSQEEQTQRLVNDELLSIDWNDVDQYPLFEACDETANKEAQRNCFQEILLRHFSEAFNDTVFEVETDLNDSMNVVFKIDEDGFITIAEINQNEVIDKVIPNFKNEISQRLNDFTVKPAIKRGIPVSLKVKLPIVLNTNN